MSQVNVKLLCYARNLAGQGGIAQIELFMSIRRLMRRIRTPCCSIIPHSYAQQKQSGVVPTERHIDIGVRVREQFKLNAHCLTSLLFEIVVFTAGVICHSKSNLLVRFITSCSKYGLISTCSKTD